MLAHSLRDSGTKKQLAILITLDTLHASTIEELKVSPIKLRHLREKVDAERHV